MESLPRTPNSEVTATLERFEKLGLCQEHLRVIRCNQLPDEAFAPLVEMWNRLCYADEEVQSSHTYPDEYQNKTIEEQIRALLAIPAFKDLNVTWALEKGQKWYDSLDLPKWVEGPLVYIWHEGYNSYSHLLEDIFDAIEESRGLHNHRVGLTNMHCLEHSELLCNAEESLKKNQPGDVIIVPSQAGIRFRGKSSRRAEVLHDQHEFSLGAVAEGCRILTHPELHTQDDCLGVCCGGDKLMDRDKVWVGSEKPDRPYYVKMIDGRVGFGGDYMKRHTPEMGYSSGYFPHSS